MPDFPRDDLIRMVELDSANLEFRADSDSSTIGTLYGYAAVFNRDTVIDSWEGNFIERIAPGAFAKTLTERADRVKVLFNHGFDPSIGDKPLGKPRLMEERSRGLYVEVPLEDTSYNRDLVPLLKSGALDGMSFRFSVTKEEWEEANKGGKLPVRTLREVKLLELGPVTFPAYEATTAGVRGRDAYRAWRTAQKDFKPNEAASGTSEGEPDKPHAHLSDAQKEALDRSMALLADLQKPRSSNNGQVP